MPKAGMPKGGTTILFVMVQSLGRGGEGEGLKGYPPVRSRRATVAPQPRSVVPAGLSRCSLRLPGAAIVAPRRAAPFSPSRTGSIVNTIIHSNPRLPLGRARSGVCAATAPAAAVPGPLNRAFLRDRAGLRQTRYRLGFKSKFATPMSLYTNYVSEQLGGWVPEGDEG